MTTNQPKSIEATRLTEGDTNAGASNVIISAEALASALRRIASNTATDFDKVQLQREVLSGQLSIARGDGALSVGGSADGAVVVTGDNNVIVSFSGSDAPSIRAALSDLVSPVLRDRLINGNLSCPYRGLNAFRPEDAEFFFGREEYGDKLSSLTKLKQLVAVIGPSGSGKSSIVFAGLIPKLQTEPTNLVYSLRPGPRPLLSLGICLAGILDAGAKDSEKILTGNLLAEHIRDEKLEVSHIVNQAMQANESHRHLYVVIDQFEELYTVCGDARERIRFLDAVLEMAKYIGINGARCVHIVATLRADFLGYALEYRPLADVLHEADIKIGPMSRDELIRAIELPSKAMGVQMEEGLSKRILDAVLLAPGNLPLLEFALTELWTRQRDGWLTHAAYDEVGGVEKALINYADEMFLGLETSIQQRAAYIFTQLVLPGRGTDATRRIALKSDFIEEDWLLVEKLASTRLLTTGRDATTEVPTVELAHEALIREWHRFHGWMEEERAFRRWQEWFRAAMENWRRSGEETAAQLRGRSLAEAERWLNIHEASFTDSEIRFIVSSGRHRPLSSIGRNVVRIFSLFFLACFAITALPQFNHHPGDPSPLICLFTSILLALWYFRLHKGALPKDVRAQTILQQMATLFRSWLATFNGGSVGMVICSLSSAIFALASISVVAKLAPRDDLTYMWFISNDVHQVLLTVMASTGLLGALCGAIGKAQSRWLTNFGCLWVSLVLAYTSFSTDFVAPASLLLPALLGLAIVACSTSVGVHTWMKRLIFAEAVNPVSSRVKQAKQAVNKKASLLFGFLNLFDPWPVDFSFPLFRSKARAATAIAVVLSLISLSAIIMIIRSDGRVTNVNLPADTSWQIKYDELSGDINVWLTYQPIDGKTHPQGIKADAELLSPLIMPHSTFTDHAGEKMDLASYLRAHVTHLVGTNKDEYPSVDFRVLSTKTNGNHAEVVSLAKWISSGGKCYIEEAHDEWKKNDGDWQLSQSSTFRTQIFRS